MAHGDFFNAWNSSRLSDLIDKCLLRGRDHNIDSCRPDLSTGR